MARKKKTVTHYDDAITRLSALKSIDSNLDLGNGLTVGMYEAQITDLRNKLNDYNTQLSLLDAQLNDVLESEKTLKDWSERMLAGVAAKYGKNSNEYEKAGGVKKSEYKKATKPKS